MINVVAVVNLKAEDKEMDKEIQEIFDAIDTKVAEMKSKYQYWIGGIYIAEEKFKKLYEESFVCSGRFGIPRNDMEKFLESVRLGTLKALKDPKEMMVWYRPIYKGMILYPYSKDSHSLDIIIE